MGPALLFLFAFLITVETAIMFGLTCFSRSDSISRIKLCLFVQIVISYTLVSDIRTLSMSMCSDYFPSHNIIRAQVGVLFACRPCDFSLNDVVVRLVGGKHLLSDSGCMSLVGTS